MSRCVCALALFAAVAACSVAEDAGEKRAQMASMPFVLGSRYGRSPPRLLTPRNDRFFMGSRYGKRSGLRLALPPLPGSSAPLTPLWCSPSPVDPVAELYRCRASSQRLYLHRRSVEEAE